MTPRAIFFDAAGTLIFLPRPVGEHYAEVAARFGVQLDAKALEQAFRNAWRASPARPPTPNGRARPDDDKEWWRELVGRVLQFVLPPAKTARFNADAYFEMLYAHFAQPGVWAVFPEVVETLRALRQRGLRLAVVSNFDRRLLRILDDLDLSRYFERVVLSSEVGADKPDPRIFQFALDALGCTAEETWHGGDDRARDGGAAALGIRVLHIERPAHSLADVIACLDASGSTA